MASFLYVSGADGPSDRVTSRMQGKLAAILTLRRKFGTCGLLNGGSLVIVPFYVADLVLRRNNTNKQAGDLVWI